MYGQPSNLFVVIVIETGSFFVAFVVLVLDEGVLELNYHYHI